MTTTHITKEIREETIQIRLEYLRANNVAMRLIHGIAVILGLDPQTLEQYVAELSPYCTLLLDHCLKNDIKLSIEDAVERIYVALFDTDAWDAYSSSPGPSAYRFAAAVVLWLYMYELVGGYIPRNCPLFDRRVAAAVVDYLVTKVAYPIGETLHEVVHETRKRQSEKEVLLHLCSPSS